MLFRSHFRTVVLTNLGNSTSTGTSLSLDGSIGVASGKKSGNCGNCCFRKRMHDKLEEKLLDGRWYIYIYYIVSHDFVDTLPKYQQNHVI